MTTLAAEPNPKLVPLNTIVYPPKISPYAGTTESIVAVLSYLYSIFELSSTELKAST